MHKDDYPYNGIPLEIPDGVLRHLLALPFFPPTPRLKTNR